MPTVSCFTPCPSYVPLDHSHLPLSQSPNLQMLLSRKPLFSSFNPHLPSPSLSVSPLEPLPVLCNPLVLPLHIRHILLIPQHPPGLYVNPAAGCSPCSLALASTGLRKRREHVQPSTKSCLMSIDCDLLLYRWDDGYSMALDVSALAPPHCKLSSSNLTALLPNKTLKMPCAI